MATTKEKWQEIANRGLQDRFDPQTRAKFDEAVNRGLIALPQPQVTQQPALQPQQIKATQQQRIEALPELGGGGLLAGQDPLTGAAITPALLTTTDPRELGQILSSSFPGVIGITETKEGELIATNNDTGVKVSLNKPGLSQLDVVQALGIASAFTPAARAAIIPSAIARRAGVGAVTAGATQTAIETGQAAVGGEFDPGEVALATGLGAAVEVAAPLVAPTARAVRDIGLEAVAKVKLSRGGSPLAKEIAEESTGQVKKSFEQRLTPSRKFGRQEKESIKQGFGEGMVTVITNSTPIDKRRMLQMIKTLEKGKGDPKFQAINRPADVAGDSLVRKIDFLQSNKNQAGMQLGRVAKNLKGKEVDIDEPVQKFFDDAGELGVTFGDDLKPNFEGSDIETIAPAKKLIRDIALKIKRNPTPDALDAHKFKRFIDEVVTFGKTAQGLGGQTERVAKKLRSGINDTLSGQFGKYKEANVRFSETITAIESLQKAAGKNVDFFGPNADKALGTVLRRLESNAQSRVPLMDAIKNVEIVTQKFGGAFDDDVLTQTLFADELEALFGGVARTSLKGQVTGAGIDVAVDVAQMTLPGAVAVGVKAGAKRLRGINEKNALKSIKELLKQNN